MANILTPEVAAEQERMAVEALACAPANIAALIERGPLRLTMATTLHRMDKATSREGIRSQGGYFAGLLWGAYIASDIKPWTSEEYEALADFGQLQENMALLRLVEE